MKVIIVKDYDAMSDMAAEIIANKIKEKKRRDIYYEATKYLNVLGGTYVLDYFTSEELEQKIIKYMKSIKGASCIE